LQEGDFSGSYNPVPYYHLIYAEPRQNIGAAVQLQDGTIEWRPCTALDYMGKQVVMNAEYKKSRNEEI
jgi:hypothetical protein